jgi:hypothetical protein
MYDEKKDKEHSKPPRTCTRAPDLHEASLELKSSKALDNLLFSSAEFSLTGKFLPATLIAFDNRKRMLALLFPSNREPKATQRPLCPYG